VAAHAKNIAHKVASGEILVNLDCDVLIPEGFCEYIDAAFSSGNRIVMAFESEDMYGNNGCRQESWQPQRMTFPQSMDTTRAYIWVGIRRHELPVQG
jgi:hypothetical protein